MSPEIERDVLICARDVAMQRLSSVRLRAQGGLVHPAAAVFTVTSLASEQEEWCERMERLQRRIRTLDLALDPQGDDLQALLSQVAKCAHAKEWNLDRLQTAMRDVWWELYLVRLDGKEHP